MDKLDIKKAEFKLLQQNLQESLEQGLNGKPITWKFITILS